MKAPHEYTLSEVSSILATCCNDFPEEKAAVALLNIFLICWQGSLRDYIVKKEQEQIAVAHQKTSVPKPKQAKQVSFDIDAGICVR